MFRLRGRLGVVGAIIELVVVVIVVVVVVVVVVVAVAEQVIPIEGTAVGIDEVGVVQQPVEGLGLADLSTNLEIPAPGLVGVTDTGGL